MKAGQCARKRPVYVNDTWCESTAAGAREASRILKRKVGLWEIQRILAGKKQIAGLKVKDAEAWR